MVTKTVTYYDFNDNERTETANFHLSQTELLEMAIDMPDGVSDAVGNDPTKIDDSAAVKLMETLGSKGILDFIKKLLMKSYGVKSEDGRRFIKSEELSIEFSQTPMFDAIITEFMSDEDAANKFVMAVIPKSAADKMAGINKPALLPNV